MSVDLSAFTVQELLGLTRETLAELQRRQVIRTLNAPAGDWAELIAATALGGVLAPNSEKSYDVLSADGKRLQVKARMLDPTKVGSNILSAIRTWDFDELFVVLFDPGDFQVRAAASIPAEIVKDHSSFSKHANAWRVRPTPDLLSRGVDWTDRVRAVAEAY